jgi:mannose-1-phosphate guanylyltransferase
MRAVLLAAGRGERLRPLTNELPKCLAPINGRPLIDYWLRNLAAIGVERFLINLHYRADMVQAYLESTPFARQVEFVHEESLLGTGGTLLANRRFLESGSTLVAHVDNLCQCDLAAFADAHRSRPEGTELTLMTFRTPDPRACGIVELDEHGTVRAFHEKAANPPGDLASAAVFIVEPSLIPRLEALGRPVFDLSKDVLPGMLGRMLAWHNTGYHRDIGTPEAWFAAQLDFPGDGRKLGAGAFWTGYWGASVEGPHATRIVAALKAACGADQVVRLGAFAAIGPRLIVTANRFRQADLPLLRDRYYPQTTLVLFWMVPASFSAAHLYGEHRIRSIGFCAEQAD